jgi:hypothetical protein
MKSIYKILKFKFHQENVSKFKKQHKTTTFKLRKTCTYGAVKFGKPGLTVASEAVDAVMACSSVKTWIIKTVIDI